MCFSMACSAPVALSKSCCASSLFFWPGASTRLSSEPSVSVATAASRERDMAESRTRHGEFDELLYGLERVYVGRACPLVVACALRARRADGGAARGGDGGGGGGADGRAG